MKRVSTERPTEVLLILALLGLTPVRGFGAIARDGDRIIVRDDTYAIALSAANGSILALSQSGKTGSILNSGQEGLWQVGFQDGTKANAADFGADSIDHSFKWGAHASILRMTYRSAEVTVAVTVKAHAEGVDFAADVTPGEKVVLDFALPARLCFDPDHVERFVFPIGGNASVGVAFNSAFFKPQDEPVGWDSRTVGPKVI
jgi:hypothetical protein